MRVSPHELAIAIIAGEFDDPSTWPTPEWGPINAEDERAFLVKLTGEDFGMDAAHWREWFAKCDPGLLSLLYDPDGTMARRTARELSWDEFLRRRKERGESL